MGNMNIQLSSGIHAKLVADSEIAPANYPVILDPITHSYSTLAPLTTYNLNVISSKGLNDIGILHNGKNSRLTASGRGSCDIELYIEDENGNYDTDILTITIG